MAEPLLSIVSPFSRVERIDRGFTLIVKDDDLYAVNLSNPRVARKIHHLSDGLILNSELRPWGRGETLCSDGKAVLCAHVSGQCRELIRLEDVLVRSLHGTGEEWHINGPIRAWEGCRRLYFGCYNWNPRTLPKRTAGLLCEYDLETRTGAFFDVGFLTDGIAIDPASRIAYVTMNRRCVLGKSLGGKTDQHIRVPAPVDRCVLSTDRKELLCSAVLGENSPITLVRRSWFGMGRWRHTRLPISGQNAIFGDEGVVFYVGERFSLWLYRLGAKHPDLILELPYARSEAPPDVPHNWAGELVYSSPAGLLHWHIGIESEIYAIVVDFSNRKYIFTKEPWTKVAFVKTC